jgi:hypothetical protein
MLFQHIVNEISDLIAVWEHRLASTNETVCKKYRNDQNRSVKQILGHMVDSATNNIHRVVHLQYGPMPLQYPNYATHGNNDRWISIQNYQNENWENLIQLWKYTHLHFLHVIQHINQEKLHAKWLADKNETITLQKMVEDFPGHFKLHLAEINEIVNKT